MGAAKITVLAIIVAVLALAPLSFSPPGMHGASSIITRQDALAGGLAGIIHDPISNIRRIIEYIAGNVGRVLLEALKQKALEMLTQKMTAYISNKGGVPRYVTNWQKELGDAFGTGAGRFVDEVSGLVLSNKLCQNLQQPVLAALKNFQFQSPYGTRNACKLSTVVSNANAFFGDFSKGGFVAYNTLMQPEGGGNIYWGLITAMQEMRARGGAEADAAKSSAEAGSGLKDIKYCPPALWQASWIKGKSLPYSDPTWEQHCISPKVTTPGSANYEMVASVMDKEKAQIVNSESLAKALTGIIANSLASKLTKLGEKGLFQVTETTSTAIDVCQGLTGEDLVFCQATKDPPNITAARSAALTEINKRLNDYSTYISDLKLLQTCQRGLCIKRGGSALSTCTLVSPPMSDTQKKIDEATSVKNSLTSAKSTVSTATDPQAILLAYSSIKGLGSIISIQDTKNQLAQCQTDLAAP